MMQVFTFSLALRGFDIHVVDLLTLISASGSVMGRLNLDCRTKTSNLADGARWILLS